ncbi:MAG TPA: 16S rRNA (adenine(1518)-N(6)/adenine(1519)-N(6))-dimethyltransferase RsmA [Arenicellales bacterium]|nr:16S rRNA (adenine(1518)-N(6)/adenine(1519)-N(6))-dimethyltransferase RsmA [Arenicellales bacterium]
MREAPARKSLGQHFLHQRSVIDAIVRFFDPRPDDIVVEIGPGRGALTEVLAPRVGALHAVELDRHLAGLLEAGCESVPGLVIHHQDALRFDYCGVGPRIRVIGNLPYNISTPLLFRLMDSAACIEDMHLMLQKEVVDRMLAAHGSRTYGRLSVMVQQRCRGELLMNVAPGAFSPPPRVQSAVVKLVPEQPPPYPVRDPALFAALVKQAFAQRRKTLRNALKGRVSAGQLERCGIRPDDRAEQLPVESFVDLANSLATD